MRGRAKTEESNAVARFDSSYSQAAEADDPGAEQRGRVQVVQLCGELEYKIAARRGILRIAAVHWVSGERRSIAKIFEPASAVGAGSVDAANPGNTDARAERQLACSSF